MFAFVGDFFRRVCTRGAHPPVVNQHSHSLAPPAFVCFSAWVKKIPFECKSVEKQQLAKKRYLHLTMVLQDAIKLSSQRFLGMRCSRDWLIGLEKLSPVQHTSVAQNGSQNLLCDIINLRSELSLALQRTATVSKFEDKLAEFKAELERWGWWRDTGSSDIWGMVEILKEVEPGLLSPSSCMISALENFQSLDSLHKHQTPPTRKHGPEILLQINQMNWLSWC